MLADPLRRGLARPPAIRIRNWPSWPICHRPSRPNRPAATAWGRFTSSQSVPRYGPHASAGDAQRGAVCWVLVSALACYLRDRCSGAPFFRCFVSPSGAAGTRGLLRSRSPQDAATRLAGQRATSWRPWSLCTDSPDRSASCLAATGDVLSPAGFISATSMSLCLRHLLLPRNGTSSVNGRDAFSHTCTPPSKMRRRLVTRSANIVVCRRLVSIADRPPSSAATGDKARQIRRLSRRSRSSKPKTKSSANTPSAWRCLLIASHPAVSKTRFNDHRGTAIRRASPLLLGPRQRIIRQFRVRVGSYFRTQLRGKFKTSRMQRSRTPPVSLTLCSTTSCMPRGYSEESAAGFIYQSGIDYNC